MPVFSTLHANTRHREPDGLNILHVIFVLFVSVCIYSMCLCFNCAYNTISHIIKINISTILILHTSILSHHLSEDAVFGLCCTRKTWIDKYLWTTSQFYSTFNK